MPQATDKPSPMREGDCPFCERRVLVYEDPARCPLCDCPLDDDRMRPYVWPGEAPATVDPDGGRETA